MKALTLTQPWATLVAIGAKTIETRSWRTSHRGWLAIHAAKAMPREAIELCITEPFASVLSEHARTPADLPRGAFVAVALLEDITPTDPDADRGCRFGSLQEEDPETVAELTRAGWWYDGGIPVAHWPQKAWGNFEPGRWAWFLEDVEQLNPPVPYRGAQGLWDVPQSVFGWDAVLT